MSLQERAGVFYNPLATRRQKGEPIGPQQLGSFIDQVRAARGLNASSVINSSVQARAIRDANTIPRAVSDQIQSIRQFNEGAVEPPGRRLTKSERRQIRQEDARVGKIMKKARGGFRPGQGRR